MLIFFVQNEQLCDNREATKVCVPYVALIFLYHCEYTTIF